MSNVNWEESFHRQSELLARAIEEKHSLRVALARLKALAAQLPPGLRSDWRDTNHFELSTPDSQAYWWLDLADGLSPDVNNCETEDGQRRGLLMDIAAEVCRLRDAGIL